MGISLKSPTVWLSLSQFQVQCGPDETRLLPLPLDLPSSLPHGKTLGKEVARVFADLPSRNPSQQWQGGWPSRSIPSQPAPSTDSNHPYEDASTPVLRVRSHVAHSYAHPI